MSRDDIPTPVLVDQMYAMLDEVQKTVDSRFHTLRIAIQHLSALNSIRAMPDGDGLTDKMIEELQENGEWQAKVREANDD